MVIAILFWSVIPSKARNLSLGSSVSTIDTLNRKIQVKTLDQFLDQPGFQSQDVANLWQEIHKIHDSFGSAEASPSLKSKPEAKLPQLQNEEAYLPIEFLRGQQSLELFQGAESTRHFLSSGTTSATRSQSHFSYDGLLLYKAQSLKIFRDVLRRFYPEDPMAIRGISLVPTTSEWPTSSLAQMLSWISEFWHVQFLSPEDFKTLKTAEGPVWVFATPFQLISLFDEGFECRLPRSSLVFETGGTKGKTREVQRHELYKLISTQMGVPQASIVSEYGMCELASQAYDFICGEEPRRFRFPIWVSTSVLRGLGNPRSLGEGALLVSDPLRIDYPWPLRTQDVCRLHASSAFELLGRVPKAVLKGCSLLTEIQEPRTASKLSWTTTQLGTKLVSKIEPLSTLNAILDEEENELSAALSLELGSLDAAKSAITDLRRSLPTDWERVVEHSGAKAEEHWLFILPNNHSLVGVYPLMVAAAAGLEISVRIPEIFEREDSFLKLFLRRLSRYVPITLLSAQFRICRENFPETIQKVCIYGDDSTVARVQELSPVPVQGFGSGLTVSVVDSFSDENVQRLAQDFLSLGQRGCMSTRVLLTSGDWKTVETFLNRLRSACRRFWQFPLTTMQHTAIDHEALRLTQNAATLMPRVSLDDVLVPVFHREHLTSSVSEILSEQPFVLPVIFYGEDFEHMDADLRQFPSLIGITACEDSINRLPKMPASVRISPLGQANLPPWDGCHSATPLFRI